jgi:predicted RecA/RadA family phage recombinase
MNARFVQTGASIDYTPVSDVAAGAVVFVGSICGVPHADIAAGEPGALGVEGVFDFAKKADDAIAAGAAVYWNDTTFASDADSGSDKVIGVAVKAAAAEDATVRVRINDGLSVAVTEVTAEAATEAEVKTGTEDGAFITPKALADGANEDDGYVKINQAAVIVDLTDAATGAEIAAAVNAVIAVLKTHGLIAAE